jgi:aminoglycoside phosphotransferase (APT) family kinase protein
VGKVYFKATPPVSAFELALTEQLSRWFPQWIPQVLAVEPKEGWWLALDGGESIRDRLKTTRNLSEWMEALERYAEMQMGLAERLDTLKTLDVPDRRPSTLPAQFAEVLNDHEILRIDREKGLTLGEFTGLQALRGPLQAWCDSLSQGNVPNSLHHGDLNSGNVLRRNGKFAFVDWGDASLAHPFSSLRTVLVSVEIVLDLPDYDPATILLRDAYLNAWAKYESPPNLLKTFALAHRCSSLVSTLSWYRSIVVMPPEMRSEYHHVVPELLKEFLYADLSRYPFI